MDNNYTFYIDTENDDRNGYMLPEHDVAARRGRRHSTQVDQVRPVLWISSARGFDGLCEGRLKWILAGYDRFSGDKMFTIGLKW